MNASFEEKSVWVQLLATLAGLGAYFVVALMMMSSGVTALAAYVPLFAAAVVLIVVLMIAGHIAAAISGRPEPRDERDRLIEWKAESRSAWVVTAGVFGAIAGMLFGFESVWIAHGLLGSVLAAESLGFILRLVYYRRGV